jgi:histidinol-phosphate aminotransferase
MVKIPKHIRNLRPYIAGKPIDEVAREMNLSRIVKLASNENPLGPSPAAREAIRSCAGNVHRYVDPGAYELTHKIAEAYGLRPEQVVCGAGTDSLLAYIIQAFSTAVDELLTSEATFIGIYVNTNKQNRTLVKVPHDNFAYDLEAIASAVTGHTRIIYLANPNNPTGSMFTAREFEAFMKRVPGDILVILDEAYASYASRHEGYPEGLRYDFPNLIVTRTFSKDYGLAALRVGFAWGPENLIRELYKVKLPFEPAHPAQRAAIASLDDKDFLERTVQLNERMLAKMHIRFDQLGIRTVPTTANFTLLLFGSERAATAFREGCLNRGLIVRHVKAFGVPEGIRINTGTEEETEFALDVISDVYAEVSRSTAETVVAKSKG